VGRIQLRTVSALLMSIVLVSPALGAVCSLLCVEGTHHGTSHPGHDGGNSPRAVSLEPAASDEQMAAHHHHPSQSPVVPSASARPSAEWKGHCCDRPAASLVAIPVMRHELPIAAPAIDIPSAIRIGSHNARLEVAQRDTSRPPRSPQRSALVLRI
jgi:hypothetical protein